MDNPRRRSATARLTTDQRKLKGKTTRSGAVRSAGGKPNPRPERKTHGSMRENVRRQQPKSIPPLTLPETGQVLELTAMERVGLRRQAHGLAPVVMIGQAGLTDAVLLEVERALRAHGLIKVKAGLSEDRAQREDWIHQITARLSAASVQQIGKTLVLYRPR